MRDMVAAEFLLNSSFHDEESDEEALRALVRQLGVYREHALAFRHLVREAIAAGNGAHALKIVEEFANRDVLGSQSLALTWLRMLEMDLESLQGGGFADWRKLRTDHVGSLLRPRALIDAFLARARGQVGDAELRERQDAAIRDVVAKQEAHGVPFVTDGEYRRLNWQVSFSEVAGWDLWETSWKGFLKNPGNIAPTEKPLSKGEDAVVSFRTPATARLELKKSFPLAELNYLKSVARRPAKITLMGPDRVCQMCDIEGSRAVYASADAFLADVVAVQRQMVDELAAAGCDYIQIDEPSYTGYVDPPTLARMKAKGEEPMNNLRRAIEADNAVIAGVKGKAITGLHICRGNRASMWHREGKYDAIAEALFGGLKYDRLLLEYDTERAGGFEPLRFVPKGVVAVLGLVTTKTGRVETVDELKRRLDDAGRHLALDQIALSPQCGFASGIAGNMLGEDEQWRKFDVMRETARQVWG